MKANQKQISKAPSSNKLQLLSDIVAFLSVIGGYQFLSFTLHYSVFEGLFGLSFNHINDIALIYIVYAILIILLKVVGLLVRLIKKEDIQPAISINHALNQSLYHVFIIITLLVLTTIFGQSIQIATLCHIAAWLFAAQINLIFSQLLCKIAVFQSIGLFGYTIEAILVIGQILRLQGIDFFEFL